MKRFIASMFLALTSVFAMAQAPVDLEAELNALLNTPLTVASSKATSLRESPGVISVISGQEIDATAPRNINDVLRLVPGFQIGYDSQGSSGLMARSFWTYEGKNLIMWDNLDITELLYGTTTLGDRFPVDQIKRIEIIRGPGSAIYGGSAELVVIKIISKDADDLTGPVAGSAGYRWAKGGFNAKEIGGMYAQVLGGYKITVGAENMRSIQTGQGPDSTTFTYLNVNDKRLTVNFMGENMYKASPDYPLYSNVNRTQWVSQNALVRYKLGDDAFSFTPFVNYMKSIPWIDFADGGGYTRREVARTRAGFDSLWTTGPWGLGFGYATYTDHAAVSPQTNVATVLTTSGATTFSETDSSAYVEGSYTGVLNVVAGGRYDHNSISGDKFVPRLALTKAWTSWYAKVLFAEAFRTPDVLNLGRVAVVGTVIRPETTRTYEFEVGNQFGANVLSGNVYWSRLKDPLVWGNGGYINGPDVTGTGLELSYKYKATWGFLNMGYAHALTDNNVVGNWSFPGDVHTVADAAKNQLTALVSLNVTQVLTANANATYLSRRMAYDVTGAVAAYPADTLLNANLTFNAHPFTVIVGAYDLLNKKAGVLPAYNSGLPGENGQGLEGVVKLKYNFK